MARYTGPSSKISRRFSEPIFGPCKELKKRNYPPGQHGRNRRRKESEYAVQLMAKQKAKYTYGVLEKQFHNLFDKAASKSGVTGTILLQLLESRLDNVVFRVGLAPTRRAARQLVSHKHITVDGKLVNVPSYLLKPGNIIGVREKSRYLKIIKDSVKNKKNRYSWIEWDDKLIQGKFMNLPEREEIPENLKEQLIVELYSK